MKKFLHTGEAVFKVLINRSLPHTKYNQKYFLSTRRNEALNRNLRMESEQKSIWEDTLPSIMLAREIKTPEDWKHVRDKLFKSGKQITAVNIDASILNFCMRRQNYNLAYSYMKFLKQENLKPNLATIGKYFKLFYLTNCDKTVEKNEEVNIMQLYKQLRETYSLLDSSTCDNIIHALSITTDWKECLKLLDEIKITCTASTSAYSAVVAAAFKNGENDLAWQLLNELVDLNRIPYSIVYLRYLEECGKAVSAENVLNDLEKLFEFFSLHDIKCDTEVAVKINEIYRKFKLNSKTTTINNKGICQNCKHKVQKFELNEQEFENLKNAILEKVIVGKNVFYKTTPAELKRFQDFVANMKKYDVVIDGLNVAYSVGTKQSPYVLASMVAAVVKYFADQNKRILVLGRTHMEKWPGKNWSYVTANADTFLAQALSQDDPYLLYCALNSGMNTIVVSKDLMRSHVFKLKEPRLRIMFNQWLTQNQYQLQFVNNQGKVFFKFPLPYIRTAQKYQNRWHIPYGEDDDVSENKWLCSSS